MPHAAQLLVCVLRLGRISRLVGMPMFLTLQATNRLEAFGVMGLRAHPMMLCECLGDGRGLVTAQLSDIMRLRMCSDGPQAGDHGRTDGPRTE